LGSKLRNKIDFTKSILKPNKALEIYPETSRLLKICLKIST